MSEIKEINTSTLQGNKQIKIDGKVWSFNLPGAGSEYIYSKKQRKHKLLEAKLDKGEATLKDLEVFEELEDYFYATLKGMFKDSTDDNSEVEAWFETTPMSVIMRVIEDIKSGIDD